MRQALGLFGTFSRGLAIGLVVGGLLVIALTPATSSRADNPYSPVWILNGIYGSGCSDWKNDTGYFPDTEIQYLTKWSGRPEFWDLATAHACWHNDEVSSEWWRAIDYPAYQGTYVEYKTYINGPNLAEGVSFFAAGGCPGVGANVWTPNGAYAGQMHYWHVTALPNVLGTYWANHYYGGGVSQSQRAIATVLDHASDSCTNTGDHLHQAIYQGGWAQPNKEGAVTWAPFSFGW